MLRKVGAVLAGVIAGFVVISLVHGIGHSLFSVDPDEFSQNPTMSEVMEDVPAGALLFVLLAYLLGSFISGLVATLVMERKTLQQAITCGIIFTVLGLINLFMIPHPIWFIIISLISYVPLAWLGGRVVLKNEMNGQEG